MIVLHFIIYGRFVGVFFLLLLCFVNLWKINVFKHFCLEGIQNLPKTK